MKHEIKVVHRKLGNKKAAGLAWGEIEGDKWIPTGEIEIDERLRGKEHLYVSTHEILHCVHPDHDERKIISEAKIISAILWKLNYRRIQ